MSPITESSMPRSPDESSISRRSVLGAGAGVVAAAAVLTSCGDDSADDTAGTGSTSGATAATSSETSASSSAAAPSVHSASLVALAKVPVGGSVVVTAGDGSHVAVAQPSAGQVVAFSAACTHEGCTVRATGKTLTCFCHKSSFDAFSGARLGGPARRPLPAVPGTVRHGSVVQG